MQVHDAGFETRGGLRLFAQSLRPDGPSRAIVAIVHGYADHSGRYLALAEKLVAAGFAVEAFDLRGHGRSPGRRAMIGRFDEYLDDVEAFLQAIRRRETRTPLFLFGQSMGGTIVTLLVAERQVDLRGVVLSAPVAKVPTDLHPVLQRLSGILSAVVPWLPVVRLDDSALSRDPAVVAAFHDDPLVYHGRLRARPGAELLRATRRIGSRLERLTVPLLIQHGTADRLADAAGSEFLFHAARSTDKTLILYDGLYHEIFNEPQRERVMSDLVRWLVARAEEATEPGG